MACHQALIEFSCFAPENFRALSQGRRARIMEAFWESDLPRFGEPGKPPFCACGAGGRVCHRHGPVPMQSPARHCFQCPSYWSLEGEAAAPLTASWRYILTRCVCVCVAYRLSHRGQRTGRVVEDQGNGRRPQSPAHHATGEARPTPQRSVTLGGRGGNHEMCLAWGPWFKHVSAREIRTCRGEGLWA